MKGRGRQTAGGGTSQSTKPPANNAPTHPNTQHTRCIAHHRHRQQRQFRLLRDITGQQFADAIDEALGPRLRLAGAAPALQQFTQFFGGRQLPKGATVVLVWPLPAPGKEAVLSGDVVAPGEERDLVATAPPVGGSETCSLSPVAVAVGRRPCLPSAKSNPNHTHSLTQDRRSNTTPTRTTQRQRKTRPTHKQLRIESPALARALFELFLGDDSVVPDARAVFASGARELVDSDAVTRAARKQGA